MSRCPSFPLGAWLTLYPADSRTLRRVVAISRSSSINTIFSPSAMASSMFVVTIPTRLNFFRFIVCHVTEILKEELTRRAAWRQPAGGFARLIAGKAIRNEHRVARNQLKGKHQ